MWGPNEVQAEGTAWNLSRHTGESGRTGERGALRALKPAAGCRPDSSGWSATALPSERGSHEGSD